MASSCNKRFIYFNLNEFINKGADGYFGFFGYCGLPNKEEGYKGSPAPYLL